MIRALRRIAGRIRHHLQVRAANARAAAELRGMNDRDLADLAISRTDIRAIEAGTYVDPRPAIFASRQAAAKTRDEAEARAADAARRVAA